MTNIEWTDLTWNPIVGCDPCSPGCKNCYAMGQAHRLAGNPKTPHYKGTTQIVNGKRVWTGKMARAPERTLLAPIWRKKPTMYFVNSMSDLFHEKVPDTWIDRVFAVMALCPQHIFQVLTKRSERMREYFSMVQYRAYQIAMAGVDLEEDSALDRAIGRGCLPLKNVWLGVSVEDQKRRERIDDLVETPAAVRFLSCEPLLEPIDITPWLDRLDWVIGGGESGDDWRDVSNDAFCSLRDQCARSQTAYFQKQMPGKADIPDYLAIREYPQAAYDWANAA